MKEKRNSILFIINALKVGGAAKIIQFVANQCVGLFDQVYFASLYDAESLGKLDNSIHRINLGINVKQNPLFRRLIVVSKIRSLTKDLHPQIVCSFVSDVSYMTRIATWGLDNIVALAERGDPNQEPCWAKPIVRWAYTNCDYCFFQLERARDYFDDSVKQHSFVIPNPFIPQNNLTPKKKKKKKTIVSAGRFTWQKGFDTLIKAFAIVHQKHEDYSLVIYGKGPLESEYHSLVKECQLDGFVQFPGYVEDLPNALKDDGVFVLSSRYEGIPNTLIEAMSVGIPTVSTDCSPGGADYLTDHGKRGLLSPVDDVLMLANNINALIENEILYKQLQNKGLSVIDELSPSRIGEMWKDAFLTMLGR